jgi:thymidylate synthase (FAD)
MKPVILRGITCPVFSEEDGTDAPITAEELVAYTARVSNPGNQNNLETAPKLLRYLVTHKHWSPFEMVHVLMEINTTRDIARQILRHRSFSFQEFSQRYAVASQLGVTYKECRLQDAKNRQSSLETTDEELTHEWYYRQREVSEYAQETYSWALANGIAKEQARAVLPEGMTNSRMYMSGSLRSWIHYILLRRGNGTQKEHRDIALDAESIIVKRFPSIAEVLNDSE